MTEFRLTTSVPFLPWSLLVSLLLLSSCMVGPDYVKPNVQTPEKYKEAIGDWKIADPKDDCDRGPWWTVFNDLELNKLEEQATRSNNTIAIADAQYRQAIALVTQARAGYFPTVAHAISESRAKSAGIGTSPSNTNATTVQDASGATTSGTSLTGAATSGSQFNIYSTALTAAWEPDLWGSVGRQVESSEAGEQAGEANLATMRLSIQGTLAQTYFQMRALDVAQKFLDGAVTDYQKFLELTNNRFKQGVAGQLDVVQAKAQLETAQVAAIDNGISRAQFEHAIAVLVGQPPSNFSILPSAEPLFPPVIPIQFPSVLLERRPDIAQAERQMQQNSALIGVALSAYYPVLTLTGTGGFNSTNFAKWFMAPAQFWTFGPLVTSTLFDGGLRAGKVSAARATYDQSVANYRQVVLAAFQDVEDNIAALRILKSELSVQNQAVESAKSVLKITVNQYKAGTVAYTDVVTAQTGVYTAEKNAIAIAGRQMVAAVGLIKALGGGWDVSQLHTPRSDNCCLKE